jgi:DNA-binding CsgD family transcriptional regulator
MNLTNTISFTMNNNFSSLTKREIEIMCLLLQGKLNKEIACHYQISIDTVKKHVKNSYKKMGVRNRAEAISHLNRMIA